MASELNLTCENCKNGFIRKSYNITSKVSFCSVSCKSKYFWKNEEYKKLQTIAHKGQSVWMKGRKHSLDSKIKMSKSLKGRPSLKGMLGKSHSEETKKQMSECRKGIIPKNVLRGDMKGEKNPRWISDRAKLKKYEGSKERRSQIYKEWRKKVCDRDSWKCRIGNIDCCGRLEVHHILGWVEHPELRYQVNNGITLCHAHHPKKRAEEKRLTPYFQELVSVSNLNFGIRTNCT